MTSHDSSATPPPWLLPSGHLWDAQLLADLAPVTVDGTLGRGLASRVLDVVARTGFAIVDRGGETPLPSGAAMRETLLDFGGALGQLVVQSLRNELIEDVKDFSDTEVDDRGYRSGGELTAHSDPPTLIALHCVQPARSGGESALVSVASVVAAMHDVRPDLVAELFAPLPQWRVAGQRGIEAAGPDTPRPVLAARNDTLSCLLYRPYIDKAAAALGTPLTAAQTEALDLFESTSLRDDLTLRFSLEPGQTLVVHNRTVLHARTNFDDWPELHRRRHLLRMWIDAPQALPVDPAHELGDIFGVAP